VDTLERDVDPVGACIGARGSRIQVVVNELRGEKIDVIRWSPDPATYIANALSPARVEEVLLVNPEGRQAHILVAEDQLSLAIGKEGQNVRLAARLTGWKIDIKDIAKYDYEAEHQKMQELQAAIAQREAELADEEEDEEPLETETPSPAHLEAKETPAQPLAEDEEDLAEDEEDFVEDEDEFAEDEFAEDDEELASEEQEEDILS
jgi:N utilization substance protein A